MNPRAASRVRNFASGALTSQNTPVKCERASRIHIRVDATDKQTFAIGSNWNPVVSEAFWTVAMDGINFNGSVIPGTAMNAAIDSGTS